MLIEEFNILLSHGKQYISDIDSVSLSELFRGRPEITPDISSEEALMLKELCPTGAIENNPLRLDLGKCVFCKECEFALPQKIHFTNDYKIASNDTSQLLIYPGNYEKIRINEKMIRREIRSYFGRALKLRQISAAGDNSCEMELNATGNVNFDMGRWGIEFVASPRHADGIVLTGPISENMAKPLQIAYDAIPAPKLLILAGTDAISGGIYRDGRALKRSFLDTCKPDLFVPGNPVHPLSLITGLMNLMNRKIKTR